MSTGRGPPVSKMQSPDKSDSSMADLHGRDRATVLSTEVCSRSGYLELTLALALGFVCLSPHLSFSSFCTLVLSN